MTKNKEKTKKRLKKEKHFLFCNCQSSDIKLKTERSYVEQKNKIDGFLMIIRIILFFLFCYYCYYNI